MFLATSAHGHGGEDDSAVIKMFQALTGIELPSPARPVSPDPTPTIRPPRLLALDPLQDRLHARVQGGGAPL